MGLAMMMAIHRLAAIDIVGVRLNEERGIRKSRVSLFGDNGWGRIGGEIFLGAGGIYLRQKSERVLKSFLMMMPMPWVFRLERVK